MPWQAPPARRATALARRAGSRSIKLHEMEGRHDQLPSPSGERLQRVLSDTAARLERRAESEDLSRINERDHLAPEFGRALQDVVAGTSFRSALPGERKIRNLAEWPRIGDVDALIGQQEAAPVFVELKCGSTPDALCACAWDLAKLALALRTARASEAYLVAGAPSDLWEAGMRGAEFFSERREHAENLNERFGDWWEKWERLGDPLPLRVPAATDTVPAGRADFAVGDTPWSLRLSRVIVPTSDWYEWQLFLRPFDVFYHSGQDRLRMRRSLEERLRRAELLGQGELVAEARSYLASFHNMELWEDDGSDANPVEEWPNALQRAGMSASETGLWTDGSETLGAVITRAGLFVGWVDVTWPHPGIPLSQLRDVLHLRAEASDDLKATIEELRRLHASALLTCRYCGEGKTPGRMHSDDVCHACAERHLRIVH